MSRRRIRGAITTDLEFEVVQVYRNFFSCKPMVELRIRGQDMDVRRTLQVGDTLNLPYRLEINEC